MRTLTVRYLLAHFKYLHEGAKVGLLQSRPLCVALFQHLADDPADVVNEILSVTEQNVLKDNDLLQHRSAKQTLLTSHNLERVTEVATRSHEGHPSAERAFAWLMSVCTTPSYGVLWRSGWYPAGTAKHDQQLGRSDDAIDLGLDSLEFYDRADRPNVRNTILLAWIQTLRPHAHPRERELLLACFESAPELVAAYFAEKNMQLDPRLSNTWIGYASFLFETIRLARPRHLGNVNGDEDEANDDYAELPPQSNIVMENLLPRPLTQKVLTRCLNQSSSLITFFAVRLLVLAFEKLSGIQAEMRKATQLSAAYKYLWQEDSERLLTRFTERIPAMKDVIGTFRKTPDGDEHALQREAVSRLLRLYYEVTPVQALAESFDVSTGLTAALARADEVSEANELGELRALELQHLLVIAKHSPGMRWFNKQGALKHSPIVSLLRLHAKDHQNREVRSLLWDVLSQHDLLANEHELESLVASLLNVDGVDEEVWTFTDDCMLRASKQPVKYVDQLEAAASKSTEAGPDINDAANTDTLPGLLIAVVAEQVAFANKKPAIMQWTVRFSCNLSYRDDHDDTTRASHVLHRVVLDIPACRNERAGMDYDAEDILPKVRLPQVTVAEAPLTDNLETVLELPFVPPEMESDNHPELLRWAQKDLGVAIEDGDVDALMLCLCSAHVDVRRQAHAQLRNLVLKLRGSAVEDRDQFCMLIGELVETFEQQCLSGDKSLPYLTGSFAKRALHVLQEATHFMYPKMNRYLIKSPEWRITRMPSYWLSNTVLSRPEEDDAYWKEVQWVLDWLVDGLRTEPDLDILRRGGVFEKVTALYWSPAAGKGRNAVKDRVVELLYRATCVEGGSGTLVTRAGVLAWLEMASQKGNDVAGLMKRRVLDTSDTARLRDWSGVEVA